MGLIRDADEIQRLWTRRINTYDERFALPAACDFCKASFASGTVVSVFGDLELAAAVKSSLCERCAHVELVDGAFPSLSLVYVEEQHRVRVLASLPQEVRDRVLEGETIIENIARGLRALVSAGLAEMVRDDRGDLAVTPIGDGSDGAGPVDPS